MSVAAVAAATLWVPVGYAHVGGVEPQRALSVPSVGSTEVVSAQPADDTNEDAITARVVVGWGGQVTAVWFRDTRRRSDLFASVRAADGVWSDPVQVSGPAAHNNSDWLDVAAGRGAHVSAVWRARGSAGHQQVLEVHRDGAGWSTPHRLGRSDSDTGPHVAVDGRGETTVVWFDRGTRVASRRPDGVWSATRRYVRPGMGLGLSVAANRAGDEVLMWDNSISRTCVCMWTAYKPRGGTRWGRAVRVRGDPFYLPPALGTFASGRVLAAWSASSPDRLLWTLRSRSGHWSRQQRVKGHIFGIDAGGGVDLSVAPHGHALAVLGSRYGGTFVARYQAGHGFGNAIRLTRRPTFFDAVGTPLMTADGTAVVAGQTVDGAAYRWQAPRQAWSHLHRLDPNADVASVDGRGHRMALLFRDHGLHARIIDVNPTS